MTPRTQHIAAPLPPAEYARLYSIWCSARTPTDAARTEAALLTAAMRAEAERVRVEAMARYQDSPAVIAQRRADAKRVAYTRRRVA